MYLEPFEAVKPSRLLVSLPVENHVVVGVDPALSRHAEGLQSGRGVELTLEAVPIVTLHVHEEWLFTHEDSQ